MAEIYVRRTSTPCIRRGMGDVKACHVDTWQSIRNLTPCITRGFYCEFTSRSKRRFLLAVLWLFMKYCHHLNVSETSELDPATADGTYIASKLLEKGALWRSVSGRKGAPPFLIVFQSSALLE